MRLTYPVFRMRGPLPRPTRCRQTYTGNASSLSAMADLCAPFLRIGRSSVAVTAFIFLLATAGCGNRTQMKPVVKTSTPKDLTTPYQQELTSFTDSLQVALRLDTIIDQFVFHAYKPGLVTFSYRYVIVSQNLSQVHSDRLEELEGVIISRLRLTAPAIRPVENIQVIFQGHGWPVIREGVYRASDHFQKRRPL